MKALVIDDHPVFIAALETILKGIHRDIDIDSAASAEAALGCIEYQPDYQFILLDLTMPGLDGFAFLRALQRRQLPIPVVVISSSEAAETVHACISAGAVGFIPKSYDAQQIANAIRCIQQGEIYLPATFKQTAAQSDHVVARQRCEQIGITEKAYLVLVSLAKGKTNKEIAEELHISVHTVKAHLAKLSERLQTVNRMDTVMEAIRLGLIED